jgi:ABC-type branched-subunit amino acid transport system substrate-binding protein
LSGRTRKATAASLLLLAATVALSACAGVSRQGGGRHTLDVKVGDIVPISWTEEAFGASGQKATDLAVSEIRKAITEVKADHRISIEHQNYRSEPNLAQEIAGKFVRAGKSCIIGPWSTGAVIPVATTITVPKKIIEITPAAGTPALSSLEIGGYFSRTLPPAQLQGNALATLIAREIGGAKGKKVSVGALDNLYGAGLVKTFSAAWEKLGGKISAKVVYEQNLPDYKKQAKELVAGKPDAWAFFDFSDNYARVATDLIKTHKWSADRSFGTDSLAISTMGSTGGATVEGFRGVAPSYPRLGANAEAFDKLWTAGPPPKYRQPFDPQAFDAVVLCYLATVAAGSTKGSEMRDWIRRISAPPGTKYTWRQLPQAIDALETGKDIDYEGASGPIDMEPFDKTVPGDPTAGYYDAYRYKDARLSLYASIFVSRDKAGIENFPTKFVSPPIPGVGPEPGATGATGASGATGATGAKGNTGAKKKAPKKSKKKNGT